MNDDSTNNMDVEMEEGEENDDIYDYGDTSDGSGGNHSNPYQYGSMSNNNLHGHHRSRSTSGTASSTGAQPPLSTIMYGQQQQQQQRPLHHQTGGTYQNGGYVRRFSNGTVPFGSSSNGSGPLSTSIGDTLDAASAAIAAVDMLSFHHTNSNSNHSTNLHQHGSQHSTNSFVHSHHHHSDDGGGGDDETDLGYEPCMPQSRRGSMTADEERQRRASIKAVMADTTLSPLSKRRSIQNLMDGRRKSMSSMIPTMGGSVASSGMHGGPGGVGLPPTGRRNSMSGYISTTGGHGGIPPGGRRFSMNSGITSSNYPGMSYLPYANSNHHQQHHHQGSNHSVASSENSCGNGDASVGDTSTSATDLQCSNDSSYLDHYGYNQNHNSNSTNTDIRSSSPMTNDTNNSPFLFNNNSNTNDSNNPRKNYFLQRQSQKCFAISNEQTRFTEQMRPPCSHYVRNCTIIAACCGAAFGCRLCHDESPNLPPKINNGGEKYHRSASLPSSFVSMEQEDTHHTIDRFAIAEIICRQCFTRQSSKTNNCVRCNIQFGEYHCKVCNLWMSNEERPYHCEHCGFCRVGGAENFQHCHRCGMCIDISLIETHNCKAGKYRSNCPVCQEFLFSSRGASHEMPCGHAIHWECFRQLAVHDSRCPICKKTAETRERMIPTWTAMAASIAMQPLPPELARVVSITCNDCESSEDARAWHFLGMQCNKCQSFNTVVDRIHLTGEEAHEFLETNARIAAAYQQRLQANNSGDDNNEEQPEQPRRRVNRRRSAF